MKAAIVTEQGLALRDVPEPKPGPEQVLIRLRAIGLNRADLGVAAGHKHGAVGGPGAIPGLEGAGEVAREESGREAVFRVVGERHRLLLRVEAEHRRERAEGFPRGPPRRRL